MDVLDCQEMPERKKGRKKPLHRLLLLCAEDLFYLKTMPKEIW